MTPDQILDGMRQRWAPEALFARDGVRKVDLSDVLEARDFPALLEEYGRESAIEGMPPPRAKIESYRALEWSGALHVFAAAKDRRLVGFITILAPPLPHYDGVPVAVSESFFVAAAHRKGGAGLRLLAAAEAEATRLGSPGLIVCAPLGGRLCSVLPRRGYVETNRVFFKKVGP